MSRSDGSSVGVAIDLESRLCELFARGRAAHPPLKLDDETFVRYLGACGAPVLDDVHAEDLYLACACLAHDSAAIEHLRALYRPFLTRYLARVRGAKEIFDEVEQQAWNGALVGTGDGPKLATYSGRGSLGSWIGISGQRIALMMLRHERVEVRVRHEAAAQHRLVTDDPELAVIKDRYREQFKAALEAGISTLDDRPKRVLQMHLVDGLPLLQIAKAYGVHHESVRRWFAAAREHVLEEAKRQLRDALPLSTREFDSIAGLLVSQLDLSISAALAR